MSWFNSHNDRTDEVIEVINETSESLRELSEQMDDYIKSQIDFIPDENKPDFEDKIDDWITKWQ